MPLILRTSCYPCHQVTASEVDPGTNNLMSCRDCRFWAKIGGWKVENLWHYGVDLQGQNSDMMYIYIYYPQDGRIDVRFQNCQPFAWRKPKRRREPFVFSPSLCSPPKKTKLPKQKKETPPHHLTSGHSIQVQSQHSACFSLTFLLTSTTRTPWHQIR